MREFELVTEPSGAADGLRQELLDADLTGVRVTVAPVAPETGTLGLTEIVTVLASSGTLVALATALNTWLRNQGRQVRLSVRRSDGTVAQFEASGPDSQDALRRFLDGPA